MKRFITLTALIFGLYYGASAQIQMPSYDLLVQNENIVGSDVHFDLAFQNTDPVKIIYLGSGDIVLDYMVPNFGPGCTLTVMPVGLKLTNPAHYTFMSGLTTNQFAMSQAFVKITAAPLSFENVEVEQSDPTVLDELEMAAEKFLPAEPPRIIAHCVLTNIVNPLLPSGLMLHDTHMQDDFTTLISAYVQGDATYDNRWISHTITPFDGPDYIFVSVTPGSSEVNGQSIGIFPNPAVNEFSIKAAVQSGPVRIEVFTTNGTKLFEQTRYMSGDMARFSVPADLSAGAYLMRVYNDQNLPIGTASLRIVR